MLKDAASHQSPIQIIYMGGSIPGTTRSIVPISITAHHVRAHCIRSGQNKLFALDMVYIPSPGENYMAYDLKRKEFENIPDVIIHYAEDILRAGWTFEADAMSITLFGNDYKGNTDRRPKLSIRYETGETDGSFEEQSKPRVKPWVVGSVSFSNLSNAANRFIESAISFGNRMSLNIDFEPEHCIVDFRIQSLKEELTAELRIIGITATREISPGSMHIRTNAEGKKKISRHRIADIERITFKTSGIAYDAEQWASDHARKHLQKREIELSERIGGFVAELKSHFGRSDQDDKGDD
ncbi:hypothetical protein P7L78_19040 [Tistrella bauzanensis]|uniref:hypothetical protein n=1 Tax=Tistrella TaxID=171436 RepID=UPI0031F71E9B